MDRPVFAGYGRYTRRLFLVQEQGAPAERYGMSTPIYATMRHRNGHICPYRP